MRPFLPLATAGFMLAAGAACAADVSVARLLGGELGAGRTMTMERVTFPPGAGAPPHHHAGAVGVYVLRGAILSGLNGGAPTLYKAGDSFFEPPGSHHTAARNASATEPAEILAVHVAPSGADLTTFDEKP